jgi:hypothetical protein
MKFTTPLLIVMGLSLSLPGFAADKPQHVSPKGELQLQNTLPSVRSFSIKTEGSVREEAQLNEVRNMVQTILNESQPKVVSIPVAGDPSGDAFKIYNRLEIVIGAVSPENEGDAYTVTLTLREEGEQGKDKVKNFDYKSSEADVMKQKLYTFLTENLQLKPRSAP